MAAELEYDIIVVGAGIAGLWLAVRLKRDGFNVILVEEGEIGGVQTLASQGMIHGGQKYTLTGTPDPAAAAVAAMPERWEKCFGGYGDLDLTSVAFTSDEQVMWPAGGSVAGKMVAEAAVFAAAQAVNAGTEKMKPGEFPAPLADMRGKKKFKGAVYRLPEKVLDVKSLARALAQNLDGRIFRAAAEGALPDGHVTVGGKKMRAQAVIFAAGAGNEKVFEDLKVETKHTQRRPLRQVMVKPLDEPLNGHGIVASPKPRATVTSHPLPSGEYVWYLGGNIAEQGAKMTEEETLRFAKAEMKEMFPLIDWDDKEWATWAGDRAEPFAENGQLPPGPHIHQRGQVLIAWPVKLTFAPLLADKVLEWLKGREIRPLVKTAPPDLPPAQIGAYPWERAKWVRVDDQEAA
jgi:glycine/D-amino acid oxidase-like deaminating enzyme